ANAFAFGQQVYFGAGSYVPESQGGRRLLAHELAHVVQQRQGRGGGVLQRGPAAFLKKYAKLYGQKGLAWGQTQPALTPEEEKKAKEMQDRMTELKGREVKSKDNPKLPEAYYYVEIEGKIARIRRRQKWVDHVQAWTIIKGRIQPGFFRGTDDKNRARAQLRKALQCKSENEQAHHVVPLELRNHEIVEAAEANGWEFNGVANVICLMKPTHEG